MRVYLSYLKLRVMTFMQYRTSAIAGLMTQLFWGAMFVFIYMALYQNGDNQNISSTEVISYTWLHQAFYAFLAVRVMDDEITNSIKNGEVAYEIIRPYNLYFWWYVKALAKRMVSGLMRFLPVLIVAIILPSPYGLNMPKSLMSFMLFLISLILGLFVVTGLNMLVHTIGFFTYNETGISGMLNSSMELLCGAYVPVALLPMIIQRGTYYLPFRLVSDLPFRVYSGNIGTIEGMFSIGLQVIWIFILVFAGNVIVKRALSRVFIQGG